MMRAEELKRRQELREVKDALRRTGFADPGRIIADSELGDLVAAYQEWHGLKADGWAGPITRRSMSDTRICAHPDRMAFGGRQQIHKWSKPIVYWTILHPFRGIDEQLAIAAFEKAWSMWTDAVAKLKAAYVRDPRKADVLIEVQPIDGPGGTLAWSELPVGADRQRRQRYDPSERFSVSAQPRWPEIDLVAVGGHEIGHVIGIGHIPPAVGAALMNPTYDPSVRSLREPDLREAIRRYDAAPAPRPLPPAPKPSPPKAGPPRITVRWADGDLSGRVVWER